MIGRSNLLLIIPTGDDPKFPNNKCLLWDDKAQKYVIQNTLKDEVVACSYANELTLVVT